MVDIAHGNRFKKMVYVALRVRQDLLETTGHVLHDEVIEEDARITQTVCNTAQDIVYSVSNRQTPKHVGLGLALHQVTRSETLLHLFHAANHTIGIDTVRRIVKKNR